MSQRFVNYPFAATGATAPRTMPDRLGEIKNVKDFGALGDGSTNDWQAVQNAVNWTSGPNRGTIYFPAGQYIINSPITFNYAGALNINFRGEGSFSTHLNGSNISNGYVLDRSLGAPSNQACVIIEKLNATGSIGGIRAGSSNSVLIRDCTANGITTEDSPGVSSQNIFIQSCLIQGGGLTMGGPGAVTSTDWISCDVAARMYGKGWFMGGNRIERCNTAYLLGLDSGVASTFTGTVASNVLTVTGSPTGTIKPGQQLSDGGVNVPAGVTIISNGTGTGGAGTYNLSNPTFTISTPQTINGIGNDQGASGFAIMGGTTEGNWVSLDLAGTCYGFYIGDLSLVGHTQGSGNAGAVGGILGTQYHLLIRTPNNCSSGEFAGLWGTGDNADVAGGSVGAATSRANLLFSGCNLLKGVSGGAAVDWATPSNAYTAQWLNSNISPTWTFSQLPTIGGANALEGDEFSITDSTVTGWSSNVTVGGGSNHVLVRNNGTHYTVVAI